VADELLEFISADMAIMIRVFPQRIILGAR
jgi:hypothetical protein